jgi:predicted short-subunit dehydrogenase-like oxidoreductase (DUF2520 family)
MRIGFIGAGTVGTALATALTKRDYHVVAVSSRTLSSSERLATAVNSVAPARCAAVITPQEVVDLADLVFLTVPDDAIVSVAKSLRWQRGQFAVHCSGAMANSALACLPKRGVLVGCFHPLQSFATPAEAETNIPGSAFGLEATGPLLVVLKEMVQALGGTWVDLSSDDRVLYHAAAVITSNYTVALMKMATDLWKRFGVPPEEAAKSLMPLLRGTVNNIENVGLPNCLTGPIARGDCGTVEAHLAVLAAKAPEMLPAYCELGLQALEVAIEKGKIDKRQAYRIRLALSRGRVIDRRLATLGQTASDADSTRSVGAFN